MLWLLGFIIILVISLIMALRSMKDFEQVPGGGVEYGLFLVRNKLALNLETLEKIRQYIEEAGAIISFEKLFKGTDNAVAIYGPKNLISDFPELNLLELEDYLKDIRQIEDESNPKSISVNDAFAWMISPKNNPKKPQTIKPGFLKLISLNSEQNFFWQVVTMPLKGKPGSFQVTIRAIVVDKNPVTRVELAKMFDKDIAEYTGLIAQSRQQTTAEIFDAFKKRTLIPKEVSGFILSLEEVLGLTGIY